MNGFADQLGRQEGKTLWVETLCLSQGLMLWLCADGLGRFFCSIFVWCGFFFSIAINLPLNSVVLRDGTAGV